MTDADVLVVGGGPVGLATAIAARRHGLTAIVVERSRPPIDKACGEGLMPAGVAAMAALGVPLPQRRRPIHGIRYVSDGVVAEAAFPGGAVGAGIRRTELHAALFESARAAGVGLRFGTVAEPVDAAALLSGRLRTATGDLSARYVVAADGLRSPLRRLAGLGRERDSTGDRTPPVEAVSDTKRRFGVTRHLRAPRLASIGADHGFVEVHFGDRAELYLTPVAEDEVGVAILWSGGKGGFDSLLSTRFEPALAARFAALEAVGRDRGAGPLLQRVNERTRGRLALVGDAGGYVDALTGEGLSLGLEQALALGAALVRDDLAQYEAAARELAGGPERLTRLALGVSRRPRLRRRYVAALAREPEAFSALLGALGTRRPLSPRDVPALASLVARVVFSGSSATSRTPAVGLRATTDEVPR